VSHLTLLLPHDLRSGKIVAAAVAAAVSMGLLVA